MYKFLIVFEKTATGYSAYSPDLTGCVATGSTKKETEKNLYSAIEMHIKGMIDDKVPIPKPTASSEYLVFSNKTLLAN